MLQTQDLTRFSVFSDMPQSKLKAISDKATLEEFGSNEFSGLKSSWRAGWRPLERTG